jgi:sigma-B regulation protein RsbU (phosphoserine phosphatase)
VSAPALIAALTELLAGFDGVDDDTALLALGIPPLAATGR